MNLRSSPEVKDSNVVTTIINGSVLTVNEEKNGWLRISQPSQGWVYKDRTVNICKPKLNSQQIQEAFKIGLDRLEDGQFQAATDIFSQIIQSDPKYVNAYYQRGLACYRKNRYERLQPYSKKINFDINNCENDDFGQVIRFNPNFAEAYLYRGITSSRSRYYDLTQAIRLDPNLAEAYYYRAQESNPLLNTDNEADRIRAQEAESVRLIADTTEAIRLKPNFSEAYFLRGEVKMSCLHEEIKSFNKGCLEGVEDILQAIRLNPNFAESFQDWDRGGFSWLPYSEDKQKALKKLNQRIQLAPNDSINYYSRGKIRLALAQQEGAIEDFTQAIKLSSDDPDAYYGRGLAYLQLKNYEKAAEDIGKTIQLNPDSYEAYAVLSLAYHDMGNNQKAIELSTEVIRNVPRPDVPGLDYDYRLMIAYLVRFIANHDLGKMENAKEDFLAIELPWRGPAGDGPVQTQDPSRLMAQAKFSYGKGNYTEALQTFQQAEKIICSRAEKANQQRCKEVRKLIQAVRQKS